MEHIEHGKIGWIVSVKTKAEFTVNVFDFQSIHIFQCKKGMHKTNIAVNVRDIVVQGNPRVYKALKNQMAELYEELKRIEQFSEENEELLYTLQLVAETLNGMKEDED